MWIVVKSQLTVVIGECDVVVVLCSMLHIFTYAEYASMLYVYGFCDGSATAAVEEYRRRFPMCRIRIVGCFPSCSIHYVNVVCSPVLMLHLNEHVNNMWRNRKAFLTCYSLALLLARVDFLHVSVFNFISFHFTFRGSVQDYNIHVDVEIVKLLRNNIKCT
jgi:uncharacterized membrane protein